MLLYAARAPGRPGRRVLFKGLKPILYAGKEVWPLIEGGKGVSATNHASSGAWAAAGGIGTVSAVNADSYDAEGRIIPQVYEALTRRDRHEELIKYAIDGAVAQVQRAYDIASGKGAININVLWEMGGAQRVLHGVLERTKGLVSRVGTTAFPMPRTRASPRIPIRALPRCARQCATMASQTACQSSWLGASGGWTSGILGSTTRTLATWYSSSGRGRC